MDSRATLTLMAALGSVVESGGARLAALANPVEIPADRFPALSGFAETREAANLLYEFARLANRKTAPPLADPGAPDMFWKMAHDILVVNGRSATRDAAADDPAFKAAYDLILTKDADGIGQPTDIYLKYQAMRDEWFCLQQELGSRKLELALKAVDDPARALIENAIAAATQKIADFEIRWENEGKRSAIAAAVQTVNTAQARSPQRQWNQWQQQLSSFVGDDGRGAQTDSASEDRFAATAISPSGVEAANAAWNRLSLAGPELETLASGAPQAWRQTLHPSGEPLQMESLTFEWTTVGIVRPWLDQAIFESRGWRMSDSDRHVSDGADPPSGDWPWIATGAVLVRNIDARFIQPPPPPPTDAPVIRDHRGGQGGWRRLAWRSGIAGGSLRRRLSTDAIVADVPTDGTGFAATAMSVPMLHAALATKLVAQPKAVATENLAAIAKLRKRSFVRLATMAAPSGGDAAPAPVAGPIILAGLLCKPVKLCPDPDPALFEPG